ncbi:hypothetical protein OAV41_03195 [Planctomycetota bacterium]|nr:hypothetical protein [Planctomycetota bacterium]
MKTKHILAVLSTCLVAVSFSPINFFSQAAPPPGFTMFDGKEFQFDAPDLTPDVWLPAFTCPAGRSMKITDAMASDDGYGRIYISIFDVQLRITRAANSQIIYSAFSQETYNNAIVKYSLILSPGDILEYQVQSFNSRGAASVSISGILN